MMRNLFLIFVVLFASISAHAEENKGDWIADAKTGCKVWNPVPASDESITWSGKCKDGKADGKGSLDWYKNSELQSTITGVMQDGRCAQDCSVKTKGGDSSVQAAEHWLADQKTGCQIKNPLPLPDESVSWSGGCVDGKASGPGTLRWYANSKLFLTLDGVSDCWDVFQPHLDNQHLPAARHAAAKISPVSISAIICAF